MRFGSVIALALVASFGLAGCKSSHIKDVYLSLDGEGHRRTDCIRPTKLDGVSANHYWVFVEMLAFKEDTLLTPILRNLENGNILPVGGEDDSEMIEYGNIAPGKGDHVISWEMLGPEIGTSEFGSLDLVDPGPDAIWGTEDDVRQDPRLLAWEFYLDDHSAPDDRIEFAISGICP